MEPITLEMLRHSASHVMAASVMKLFPGAKLAIGPAIDTGFYYDFDLPRNLTNEDLAKITELMRDEIKVRHKFERREISRNEALEIFADQPYKLELINELPEGETISLYQHDGFVDLCRGPHVPHTGYIKANALQLLSIAGAYWRGDEKRPMLQRIYGTLWNNKEELEAYLQHLEEIERRDHRRLGRELDLFSLHEDAGPGLVYWHPKERASVPSSRISGVSSTMPAATTWSIPAYRALDLMGDLGPPGHLSRRHVLAHGYRWAGLLYQADELSLPYPDIPDADALLSRPAPALGGARHGLPLRAVRRAARLVARARFYPR